MSNKVKDDKNTGSSDSVLIPKIDPEKNSQKNMKDNKGRKLNNKGKVAIIVSTLVVSLLVIISLLIFLVYKDALQVKDSVDRLQSAVNAQSLPEVEEELARTKDSMYKLRSSYGRIAWLRVVPYLGGFVGDGKHFIEAGVHSLEAAEIMVQAVGPYADIIGFSGENGHESGSGEETAKDRLDFVVKTLPEVIPKAEDLSEKAKLARTEIGQVDTEKYPETIAGRVVKERVDMLVEMINLGTELAINGKPLLEVSPYLLGSESKRRYLVIFQNDKELRPTGGFITAYSIAEVEKGKFEPVLSSDIYNLDDNYIPDVPAPDPIIKYLEGPYVLSRNYRLRDMNWSPDFKESMDLFLSEAKEAGIEDVDGIIAVDTEALVNLLEVLGPIGVPGYGNFSTQIVEECNCPQVIYELESFADVEGPIVWSENEPGKIVFAPENYDNRKKIIGPLMNSILLNTLGQPKEKIPALFEAFWKSLFEKHILLYAVEPEAQEASEKFGIGGIIEGYDGDYLHINDANLGGRKSNLYVTQEVTQDIRVTNDGSVEKTLTITYKNPEKFDGWLNSVLPNWVRIYVPRGSELVSFNGVEEKIDPYEELGKTVFAGYFELMPQGVSKVEIVYRLPFSVEDTYNLFIQKQPGKDKPLYTVDVGKDTEEFFLNTDKEFSFEL